MFKKLLTGGLTLSLALMGFAIGNSAIPGVGSNERIAYSAENTNAPFFGLNGPEKSLHEPLPVGYAKISSLDYNVALTGSPASKVYTPTFVCTNDVYYVSFAFLAALDCATGIAGGVASAFAQRSPVEPGFLCSLDGVWQYIYNFGGDGDMELQIWAGNGTGAPAVQVAYRTFDLATDFASVAGGGWLFVDFGPDQLYFTEDYFCVWRPVLNSGTAPYDESFLHLVASHQLDDVVSTSMTQCGPAHPAGCDGTWYPNTAFWVSTGNFWVDFVQCCEEIPFSNCELRNNQIGAFTTLLSVPHDFTGTANEPFSNCRQGLSMRFETGGYDTLKTARFWMGDYFGDTPGCLEPGIGVICQVLGDNGAGVPDPSNIIFTQSVGGFGNELDLVPFGCGVPAYLDITLPDIVLDPMTVYHVAVRWDGPIPSYETGTVNVDYNKLYIFATNADADSRAGIFYAGTYGTKDVACIAGATANPGLNALDGWYNYNALFGSTFTPWLDIVTCRDEFFECELAQNYLSFAYIQGFCEGDGFDNYAAIYPQGGEECRVSFARAMFYTYENIDSIRVGIWDNALGSPGVPLYRENFLSGSFPAPPATPGIWALDIFPNGGTGVSVTSQWYIVAEIYLTQGLAPCEAYFFHIQDDGSGPSRTLYQATGGGPWADYGAALWGDGTNVATQAYLCCLPFNERTCTPGEDWPTYQHDYARTGASFNSLGAANCNLNLVWTELSSNGIGNNRSGSVISGNMVLISNDRGYDARVLTTGAFMWNELTDPAVAPLFVNASGIRTIPTIHGGVAYISTGAKRDVIAVDAITGAYIWDLATAKNVLTTRSVVLNDGSIDVLYFSDDERFYAVDAATGLPYSGWLVINGGTGVNPIVYGSGTLNTNAISSDGSQLFVPLISSAGEGDIISIDPLTGAQNWSLKANNGGTLAAASSGVGGYDGFSEGFNSGASYDAGNDVIWAYSTFNASSQEALLYRVAADGSSFGTSSAVKGSRNHTPTIDQNQIYVPAFTADITPLYSGVGIFARTTGSGLGGMDGHIPGSNQAGDAVLSCEQGGDDWLIHGSEQGFLNFFEVGNSNSLNFYRSTTDAGTAAGVFHGGSLAPDWVVFTTASGRTIALSAGVDRPRLDILRASIDTSVPFGTPASTPIPFSGAFTNSGCALLTVDSITFDDTPSPTSPSPAIEFSSVPVELLKKMNESANYATNAQLFEKVRMMYGDREESITYTTWASSSEATLSSSLNYRAAAAFPDVIDEFTGANGLISPVPGATIAPGEIVDIVISIDGPAVTRGPHPFYATIWSDDPDYFLDDAAAVPEIELIVVGGCLEGSVILTFGVGSNNSRTVFNIPLVQRNAGDDIFIEGFEAGAASGEGGLYGGFRGFSLTEQRAAMTGDGLGFAGGWELLLGDPNYCTNLCIPALKTNVLLGSISLNNGVSYTDVYGEIAATTYVDSARDHGDPWNWESNPTDFLPDSTIGIRVNETHYGAYDIAELAPFDLIRMDITNRTGDAITDLVPFAFYDEDLSPGSLGRNKMVGNVKHAYAYAYQPEGTQAHGFVRVPHGCGYSSANLKARAGDGDSYQFTPLFMDSLYHWGRIYGGITYQTGMGPGDVGLGDFSGTWHFGSLDIPAGQTVSMAIGEFAYGQVPGPDNTDPNQFIELADRINKWAGFGRGDVNNDQSIDMADIIYLATYVASGTPPTLPGPYPFAHLGDVDLSGATNGADVTYLIDYYFGCGECPQGDWTLALCSNL